MAFAHSNRNFSSIPSTLQYIQPLNCVISSSEEIEFEIIDNHSGNKSNTSHNDYKEVIHDLTVSQNFYIPLISLWKLLLQAPLNYKHFLELRVVMLKEGILKFIINLLEDLETSKRKNSKPTEQRNPAVLTEITANNAHYWAKGTGFGTGSLTSNWDIGMTLGAKKKEEMQLMVIFQVLAAFLCDENKILHETCMIFENSCLTEVLSGFLRNDSSEENLYSETDTEELNILLYHIELTSDFVQHKANNKELSAANKSDTVIVCTSESNHAKNSEQFYLAVMSQLQFDTYEIITNKENGILQFNVPFYYESAVRSAASTNNDTSNSLRARRLAQEFATLSTSLPLSYSSTLFLRCDSERLDVIKVLITGPEDTPYENGCFEFDVYFPAEYPTSPMSINLITTGKQTIRFNPNLYNNGRVCLSILNTWSGRPEEKWNSQTSSLLQVLVSIQSLILVSEPYYNEPGYEQMRATLQGQQNSRDYNANIQQATIKWAMIEQIKNPTLCFQEIIHKHFLLKQTRVIAQCERWLAELKQKGNTQSYQSLNIHFSELKTELMKLEKNKNSGITNSM